MLMVSVNQENNLPSRVKKTVPNPQAPLMIKAVATPGGAQPPPIGSPLRGNTTNQLIKLGPNEPTINPDNQYPKSLIQVTDSAKTKPHIPPQNVKENTRGTPRGIVEPIA